MTYTGPETLKLGHGLAQALQNHMGVGQHGVEGGSAAGRAVAPVVGDEEVGADLVVVGRDVVIAGGGLAVAVEEQHGGIGPVHRVEPARQPHAVGHVDRVVHRALRGLGPVALGVEGTARTHREFSSAE